MWIIIFLDASTRVECHQTKCECHLNYVYTILLSMADCSWSYGSVRRLRRLKMQEGCFWLLLVLLSVKWFSYWFMCWRVQLLPSFDRTRERTQPLILRAKKRKGLAFGSVKFISSSLKFDYFIKWIASISCLFLLQVFLFSELQAKV